MLEKENPKEQQTQSRIQLIIDSLQDFYERIQEKLLKMIIKTKEPELKMEHQQERKIEIEPHQEFGMNM